MCVRPRMPSDGWGTHTSRGLMSVTGWAVCSFFFTSCCLTPVRASCQVCQHTVGYQLWLTCEVIWLFYLLCRSWLPPSCSNQSLSQLCQLPPCVAMDSRQRNTSRGGVHNLRGLKVISLMNWTKAKETVLTERRKSCCVLCESITVLQLPFLFTYPYLF